MSKKLLTVLAATLGTCLAAFAEDIRVTGTVTDRAGVPVIGAVVQIPGGTSGTMTDEAGTYAIEVPSDGTLYVSIMGYVPQEIAVYPDLTAFENVKLFGMLYGLKGKQLIERINDSLQKVGLLEKAKKFPKHFSGGMQRRLNIACALVHQPQLIILDEPTVGIDPQSRNMILETIEQLKKQGTSILYISSLLSMFCAGLLIPFTFTLSTHLSTPRLNICFS